MVTVYYTSYNLSNDEDRGHILGLSLLQVGLECLYNIHLTRKDIEQKYRRMKYGKPYLMGFEYIHFNISHCDGYVACAFSAEEIGVDVERLTYIRTSMVKRILTEKEQEYLKTCDNVIFTLLRLFSLKESYVKCIGLGLSMEPNLIHFSLSDKIQCSDTSVCFQQKYLSNDCVLSVCYKENESDVNFIEYI